MPGFIAWHDTPSGPVPLVSSRLTAADTIGGWKARWGLGRMTYIVPPGLYAIGCPDENSPVVVTANYKMSYDLVRQALAGRDVWILVLETYGINVWCAAGKGTFGTGELIRRVQSSGLEKVVSHRTLLLPIMGAAGVRAVEVKARSGFDAVFATLRIGDLPAFLDNAMTPVPGMRELSFSFAERAVLIPIELVVGLKSVLFVGFPLAILAGLNPGGFDWQCFVAATAVYLGAVVCGTVLVPLLLPFLPGRMFSVKGAAIGVAAAVLLTAVLEHPSVFDRAALLLIMAAVSSFYAMNFTGSTPFTSPSGVRREMALSLPCMAWAAALGIVSLIARFFLS